MIDRLERAADTAQLRSLFTSKRPSVIVNYTGLPEIRAPRRGGESLYAVSKPLGHSTIAMPQRYAHVADQSLRNATPRVGAVVETGG